jgi:hypothetical protein
LAGRPLTITQQPPMTQPIRHSRRHHPIAIMSKSILPVLSSPQCRFRRKQAVVTSLIGAESIIEDVDVGVLVASPHHGDFDPFPYALTL